MKPKINYGKKKTEKFTYMWKLNSILLNNHGSKKKSQEILENTLKQMKNKNITYQNLWDTGKSSARKKFIAIKPTIKEDLKSTN